MEHSNNIQACEVLNRQILGELYAANVCAVAMPVADHRTELGALESRSVSRMVDKRLKEFSTGRFCAHEAARALVQTTDGRPAVANLDAHGREIPKAWDIAVGPEREPCWPADIRGSITHTRQIAAAVVTNDPACYSLGLDIEPLQRLEQGVMKIIADQDELAAACLLLEQQLKAADDTVFGQVQAMPDTAACVVFSAKESIFKCLFPVYRHWLDFSEVKVLLKELSVTKITPATTAATDVSGADGIECWRGHFVAEVAGGCATAIDVGPLRGQFAVLHGLVITTAELSEH